MIAGIDVGRFGAVFAMYDDGTVFKYWEMPTDGQLTLPLPYRDIFREIFLASKGTPLRTFMEKTSTRPYQNIQAMHTFGINAGICYGIASVISSSLTLVIPSVWTKTMWEGVTRLQKAPSKKQRAVKPVVDTKATSFVAFRRLFPHLHDVTHDGIIDAALIAEYGRRQLGHHD